MFCDFCLAPIASSQPYSHLKAFHERAWTPTFLQISHLEALRASESARWRLSCANDAGSIPLFCLISQLTKLIILENVEEFQLAEPSFSWGIPIARDEISSDNIEIKCLMAAPSLLSDTFLGSFWEVFIILWLPRASNWWSFLLQKVIMIIRSWQHGGPWEANGSLMHSPSGHLCQEYFLESDKAHVGKAQSDPEEAHDFLMMMNTSSFSNPVPSRLRNPIP